MYHLERLEQQQLHMTDTPLYGILTVRVYFNHDCLFVEVLKARDILPLDSNGKQKEEKKRKPPKSFQSFIRAYTFWHKQSDHAEALDQIGIKKLHCHFLSQEMPCILIPRIFP